MWGDADEGLSMHNLRWLSLLAPQFAVNGDSVEILHTPTDFHSILKEQALGAKKRIVLAALYLGTGTLENDLMEAVHAAAKSSQDELNITILMDCNRGFRGEKNSIHMMRPLFDHYGNSDKLKIFLYHTPNLRGILRKLLPNRWNETIGVAHLKVFIFDDTLVISGANLSHDYFVDRQDRYILFHNCAQLADYFNTLVDTIGEFSLQLSSNEKVKMPQGGSHHPYDGNLKDFIVDANKRIKHMIKTFLRPDAKICQLYEEYCKLPQKANKGTVRETSISLSKASNIISQCQIGNVAAPHALGKLDTDKVNSRKCNNLDTLIYPTVQMGLFGIRQDEFITKLLFKSFTAGSKVCLTTGYFNITDEYRDMIINDSDAGYDILLSSPEANGFFNGRGFSKYIPQAYMHLCKEFFYKVQDSGRNNDLALLEYIRSGWTFHGKGIWFYPPGEKHPSMTMIGSPNYGSRSVNRDLEAQVVLATENIRLREKLHLERSNLIKYTRTISANTFSQPRYFIPRWVAFVTNYIKIYF